MSVLLIFKYDFFVSQLYGFFISQLTALQAKVRALLGKVVALLICAVDSLQRSLAPLLHHGSASPISLALSAATSVSYRSRLMMPRFSNVSATLKCRLAVAMLILLPDFGFGGAGVGSANAPFSMARDRIRGIAQNGQLQTDPP
jgi:hypothetical protein